MTPPIVIVGGGLSGLAAGIRLARFGHPVLILERHVRPGGLNSYYQRGGHLFESGLHAMTNYAAPGDRHAPLGVLFRQLKLGRAVLPLVEQCFSEVAVADRRLRFSNDLTVLRDEITRQFPSEAAGFDALVAWVRQHDPFPVRPWRSARAELLRFFPPGSFVPELLLTPVLFYGSCTEMDLDLDQFVILFRAVFLEGLCRPVATMREVLDLLVAHLRSLGGEIRFGAEVESLQASPDGERIEAVRLASGAAIACRAVVSTAGLAVTRRLAPGSLPPGIGESPGRISFVETIFVLRPEARADVLYRGTVLFFTEDERLQYRCPSEAVDYRSGILCIPDHFQAREAAGPFEVRLTHLANPNLWRQVNGGTNGPRTQEYVALKQETAARSAAIAGKYVRNLRENSVYQDTFTPLTLERYSAKPGGTVYGCPDKLRDGRTRIANLFVAGTDQGYLGIVGAMLSGVTVVNTHLLRES